MIDMSEPPEPPPLSPPFPVGSKLVYVGDREVRAGSNGLVLLRRGTVADVVDVHEGRRGSGRVEAVVDGEEIRDRTRHGSSVWINAEGKRRLIYPEAAGEWASYWGPFEVGDVVAEGVGFTGVVVAAGPKRFTVLWCNTCTNTHRQDYQVIRRFYPGFWGDRDYAAEERRIAEHRDDLVKYQAERRSRRR